jgi:intracellular septation protein
LPDSGQEKFMQTALRQLFLDFLSAIIFLTLYALTENLYLATGLAVAVSIAQIVIARMRGDGVDAMQWLVLFLVLVLGGATLIANDGRFIMVKSSITHSAIAIVMLRPGWMGRYLPPIATENLSRGFIVGAGYCWAAWMFTLAAANLFVALNFDFHVWSWFFAIGLIGGKLLGVVVQYAVSRTLVVRKLRAAASQAA